MGRDPYMRFMTGSSDPTIACREGNIWQNTTTSHDWVCNSSGVWVDQAGLTGYGYNITKNIWEAKEARGVRLYGNIFEDAWYPSPGHSQISSSSTKHRRTARLRQRPVAHPRPMGNHHRHADLGEQIHQGKYDHGGRVPWRNAMYLRPHYGLSIHRGEQHPYVGQPGVRLVGCEGFWGTPSVCWRVRTVGRRDLRYGVP